MAEFCNDCVEEIFGEESIPDFSVEKIFEELESNTYTSIICEGCGIKAIGNDDGKIIVLYYDKNEWTEYKGEL